MLPRHPAVPKLFRFWLNKGFDGNGVGELAGDMSLDVSGQWSSFLSSVCYLLPVW